MDNVFFAQYIPSNKSEISGYGQIPQYQPVQNSTQTVKPEQDTNKPSSNNNKTLNWTIGLGAAATLIALGVIAGRKGHLGDSIQEFLGGAKKTIGESTSDAKAPEHLTEGTPSGTNRETSSGTPNEPLASTPVEQPVKDEPPASIEKPVAAKYADTSTRNIKGSHSDESERLSEQNSGNVVNTPSPQPKQTSPRKPATPPESEKPPVKPVTAKSEKKETIWDKIKRFFRDPFGRKAKAQAKIEKQKQEAAKMAEEERLLAIKEQKAMEERIKLYPNMGIKQLEEHYAAHENFKEREIIYKHIQKQRFALQTKMDEKYSRMSKEQLFEELEKLQAVKADERDYDAIIIIKNQLKQKGHIVDDKLFEGHKPIEIVPYGEVGDDFNKLVNKRSSDYQGLAPTPDFLIPDFIRVSNYKISSGSGYENYFESSKYGGMYLWNNGGGMQYNWDDKGRWCVEHVLLNGERNEKYYATVLSYSNGNFMSRPHGSFAFAIPGDISKETLEKIRNYFIESGMVKEVVNSSFNRQTADPTKILDKMIEAVLDIVNK